MVISVRLWACALASASKAHALATCVALRARRGSKRPAGRRHNGEKNAMTFSFNVMTGRLASRTCLRQRAALFLGQASLREDYLNQVQRDFLSRRW
jgi:hypothetical protein